MRGLKNHNPLNIRHTADRWEGARPQQTDPSFVQFSSLAYGYRAAWKILDTYCLNFRRERRAFNVRNILYRWAPPTENDTEAYIRAVTLLTGLGGNENIPRPYRNREFYRLQRTVLLLAGMTCVENGIRMEQVDLQAIWDGYDLAYPGKRSAALRDAPTTDDDEYWDWSPDAFEG